MPTGNPSGTMQELFTDLNNLLLYLEILPISGRLVSPLPMVIFILLLVREAELEMKVLFLAL